MAFNFKIQPEVGDPTAPPGTKPWAEAVRLSTLARTSELKEAPESVVRYIDVIVKHEAWRQMSKPDGSTFRSLEEFCAHRRPWGLGMPLAKIDEYVKAVGHEPYSDGQIRFDESPPIHPAAELFPMLVPSELEALAADIGTNGLQQPVVLFDGQVLDGRNRLAACKLAGVEPRYRVLADCPSPVSYVLSTNLHRRHLTESQRGMVGARAKAQLQDEARKRQADGAAMTNEKLGRGDGDASPKSGLSVSGKWTEQACEMVSVGRGTIENSARVIEHGVPELAAAVDAGEVAVSAAAEVAKLPREEQAAVVAAGPKAVKAKAKEAREEGKAAKAKAKAPPAPPPPPRVYDALNRRINHAATVGELDDAMTALRRALDESELSEGEHGALLAGYKARHAELRAAEVESDDAPPSRAQLRAALLSAFDKLTDEQAADAVRIVKKLGSR